MLLTIDGHDLTPFILYREYNISRFDLDGENAGRTMDGKQARDFITYKRKIEIKLKPLSKDEWETIEHDWLRGKVWHTVEFEDFGRTQTAKMYQSSFNGTISTIDGKRVGAAINFIEE